MGEAVLVVVAVGAGVLLVGPAVNYAVLRWMGGRVVLPLVLGYVPTRRAAGRVAVSCRRCGASLSWDPQAPWFPPMFSWTAQRGSCRACRDPLPSWTAVTELFVGVGFGLSAWRIGWSWALLPVLAMVTGATAASVVDLACWRVPTRFIYLTAGIAALAMVLGTVMVGDGEPLLGAVIGGVTYGGLLGLVHLVSPRMLGFGDVRLGLLLGMVVGWMGWTAELPLLGPLSAVSQAMFMGCLLGMVVGLVLLVARRKSQPYPFAPWLSLGAFFVLLSLAPGPL